MPRVSTTLPVRMPLIVPSPPKVLHTTACRPVLAKPSLKIGRSPPVRFFTTSRSFMPAGVGTVEKLVNSAPRTCGARVAQSVVGKVVAGTPASCCAASW